MLDTIRKQQDYTELRSRCNFQTKCGHDFGKLQLKKPSSNQGFNYSQFPLLFPMFLPVTLTRHRGAVTFLWNSCPSAVLVVSVQMTKFYFCFPLSMQRVSEPFRYERISQSLELIYFLL